MNITRYLFIDIGLQIKVGRTVVLCIKGYIPRKFELSSAACNRIVVVRENRLVSDSEMTIHIIERHCLVGNEIAQISRIVYLIINLIVCRRFFQRIQQNVSAVRYLV